MSHRQWLKFGVQRTFHSHDVVVLTLCDSPFHSLLCLSSLLSSCSFPGSSAFSSMMWETSTLRTFADEDHLRVCNVVAAKKLVVGFMWETRSIRPCG